MARAYESSARHFGHQTYFLDTLYAREFIKPESLSKVLLSVNTTHLVILGDTKLSEHPGMSKELLRMLRARNIKVIVVLMDLLFSSKTMGVELVDFWKDEADALVVHNSRILEYFPKLENVLLWPSLPYVETESIFNAVTEKSIDLLIPGSGHRQRQLFSNYAKKHGIKVVSELSSRVSHDSQVYLWESYIHRLKEARLVFTNGYRNRRESQVIARTSEVMLSKSVLMYEKGSDIDYFFKPYYDFIPVLSLPDLVEKSRFLLANYGISSQIALNGYNTILDKFSSKRFWESLNLICNSHL